MTIGRCAESLQVAVQPVNELGANSVHDLDPKACFSQVQKSPTQTLIWPQKLLSLHNWTFQLNAISKIQK